MNDVRAGELFFLALYAQPAPAAQPAAAQPAATTQPGTPQAVGTHPRRDRTALQTKLYRAFKAVWSHYRGDPQRASVCARTLGFYHLTEQTRGAIVERWTPPDRH